jgi:hypothetical protein
MALPLTIINAESANFECIFGRGCDGLCCQNGRPSVDKSEKKTIDSVLKRAIPHLRPEAKKLVEKEGYLSNRKKLGMPMLRVVGGWCVFFNQGCVLHKIGSEDGESYQYKPSQCALFPLEMNAKNEWYVRQWGVEGEVWDLFCLNPKQTKRKAVDALKEEIELAAKFDEES